MSFIKFIHVFPVVLVVLCLVFLTLCFCFCLFVLPGQDEPVCEVPLRESNVGLGGHTVGHAGVVCSVHQKLTVLVATPLSSTPISLK